MRQTAMRVSIDVDQDDYTALLEVIVARGRDLSGQDPYPVVRTLAILAGSACVMLVYRWMYSHFELSLSNNWPVLALTVATCLASFVVVSKTPQANLLPTERGLFLGPHSIQVDGEGIKLSAALARCEYEWAAISGVVESKERYFILIDRCGGLVVPRNSFASQSDDLEFSEIVRQNVFSA